MSVLKVGLSSGPLYRGGDGISVYTAALARELAQLDCAIVPCVYSENGAAARAPAEAIRFPRSFAQQAMMSALGVQLHVASRVAVYHATDYRVARMDCPVVATLHDAVPLRFPQWTSTRLRRLKNWQIRQSGRLADHVIAHSKAAVDDLIDYFGIDESKISVVPCGVDRHWLAPVDRASIDAAMTQYRLVAGYYLFVGTLQPRKNVGRILRAYLALPASVRRDRQLVIVGREGWRCEADVAAIRAAQAAGEPVLWLDSVSEQETLRAIYVQAGVFVFPSLYEGFGLPLLEAFACGIPVIASNTSCLPEVAGGAAVEVDPLSVEELTSAMIRLGEDAGLRTQCIERGRKRALELSWERTARATMDVYRRLV
ncbi:glycosyltransferase family 1 protein [Cupriavidus necator]|uniref:glycosyltransferase family 4 protein n=1 Tax=Cupriavidus necator TaxID=106590 RepID=UPI0039C4683A